MIFDDVPNDFDLNKQYFTMYFVSVFFFTVIRVYDFVCNSFGSTSLIVHCGGTL